jgi:hypothetical protein
VKLSFYCDDTNPYGRPAETFRTFVDYCREHGIKGESSVVIGWRLSEEGLLTRELDDCKKRFIEDVAAADEVGLDTHFEILTHASVYDVPGSRFPARPFHEGVWLQDPEVTKDEYLEYFTFILDEADRVGIRYSGMTTPGYVDEESVAKEREIGETGFFRGINPAVWQALHQLATEGRFARSVVPSFAGYAENERRPVLVAGGTDAAVFELAPNSRDFLGSWQMTDEMVDPDYYITADGRSGRIVELLREGAPYCLYYSHWQGYNPHDGIGWQAFQTMVDRIETHLAGEVEWARPTDICDDALASGAYDRLESLGN